MEICLQGPVFLQKGFLEILGETPLSHSSFLSKPQAELRGRTTDPWESSGALLLWWNCFHSLRITFLRDRYDWHKLAAFFMAIPEQTVKTRKD